MPQQLNIQGKTKEEEALEFILANEPEEGYMGCFSGGKDSCVIKHLTKISGVKVKWYYSLMPDPPELIKFIKDAHPGVVFLRPEYSFWKGILIKFPPHRKARWCCNVIKEKPSKKVPLVHRLVGIRAEESKNRAKQGWVNQITRKRINYNVIFDWLEWEVWEYIERYSIPYCSLYDKGFSRIGCVVCPMRTNSKEQELYRERYPQYFKLFEKQVGKWWENGGWWRNTKRRYSLLCEDFISNWYKGK